MNKLDPTEIKKLMISSLDADTDIQNVSGRIVEAGVTFEFKNDFSDKVLGKLFSAGKVINREIDFMRSLNHAFYRIALTGVAAIVVLLLSLYIMEGSLSLNSLIGLSNNYDESIVCLLTGN